MTRVYELRHPNRYVIGFAIEYVSAYDGGGWKFHPLVRGRKSSRKFYPTADACLPAWAKRQVQQGCSFLPRGEARDTQ